MFFIEQFYIILDKTLSKPSQDLNCKSSIFYDEVIQDLPENIYLGAFLTRKIKLMLVIFFISLLNNIKVLNIKSKKLPICFLQF